MRIPFTEKEIEQVRIMPGMFGGPDFPEFAYPLSHKENYVANMKGEGYWVPTSNDVIWFCPTVMPDNASPEECKKAARFFVDKYFNQGKLCILETFYCPMPFEFLKELYIYSRKKSESF